MHMSPTPRTSIIMPVYNTASTVVAAIESVLAQTDPTLSCWSWLTAPRTIRRS